MRIDCYVAGTIACLVTAVGLVDSLPHLGSAARQAVGAKSVLAPLIGHALFFGGPDIASAQQPKAIDAKPSVPKPTADLHAGTSTYRGRVNAEGKRTDFVSTRTIKEQGDAWIVTDTAKQPAGDATDETVLAKGSLVLRKRSVVQGPIKFDYVVKDGKAIGKIQIAAQLRPIFLDLGGELFADGAGRSAVVATLPLADGYETSFRNLVLPSKDITTKRLKVVGSERVTVPAGSFNTFKVQITSDDGEETTFWIAKSPRKAVKTMTKTSEPNGVITTELQK